jgi:hypothetical protein
MLAAANTLISAAEAVEMNAAASSEKADVGKARTKVNEGSMTA